MAANIGRGMDAKNAPNFPEKLNSQYNIIKSEAELNTIYEGLKDKPNIEKKIMKAVEI